MTYRLSKAGALTAAAALTRSRRALDVRDVGSFNYDTADLSVVAQNSQCFGW